MSDSIKKQIKAAVLAKLTGLKADGQFRDVRRTRNLSLVEGVIMPCCLFNFGKETIVDEDTRGITRDLPLNIRIGATEDVIDDLEALVVNAIESDRQLGGLCVDTRYDGDEPYLDAADGEDGGLFKYYTVRYRTVGAQASVGY